jgi:hypothetical protein
MTIKRNFDLSPVKDFMTNVEPRLRNNQIAEEIYENKQLIGWQIICLY